MVWIHEGNRGKRHITGQSGRERDRKEDQYLGKWMDDETKGIGGVDSWK